MLIAQVRLGRVVIVEAFRPNTGLNIDMAKLLTFSRKVGITNFIQLVFLQLVD